MMRPATPDDTDALARLTAETGVFKPHEVDVLRELLGEYHAGQTGPHHVAVVREDAGEIVGYAYYAPDVMAEGTWYLYWIAVSPRTQGKGVGRDILRWVEDDIRKRGGRVLFLETSSLPVYEPTRRFYLRQGYAVAGVLGDYYTDGDDMVVFRKRLLGQDRPKAQAP